MTIMRVPKKQNYLVIDKTFLADKKLSWKAKGLMTYLLSLPDNWRLNVVDLMKRASDRRDSVRAILQELGKAGYIIKEDKRKANGKLDYPDYWVYETPQPVSTRSIKPDDFDEGDDQDELPQTDMPSITSPQTAFPAPVNPSPVNPTLISNKNNKYQENKKAAAVTEVVSESAGASESKKESAAASFANLKFAESDYSIGNELSEPQKQAIHKAVDELMEDGIVVPTQQTFTHQQVAAMVLSRNHFTKAGNEFCRKLNTITSQLRKGTLVLNRVNPIPTPANPEHAALEDELKKLCLNKYSEEQAVTKMATHLKDEPEKLASYADGFKASIADKAVKIEQLRQRLAEFKKTVLGA